MGSISDLAAYLVEFESGFMRCNRNSSLVTTDSSLAWPCSRLIDHHNFEDALERGEGLASETLAQVPHSENAQLEVSLC
jgi:hypothetical protein